MVIPRNTSSETSRLEAVLAVEVGGNAIPPSGALLEEALQALDPNVFDEIGFTPLHYTADKGHLAIMKLLLEAGADVV